MNKTVLSVPPLRPACCTPGASGLTPRCVVLACWVAILGACTTLKGADDDAHFGGYGHVYALDTGALKGNSLPFIAHTGKQKYGTYLAINLPYAPVARLVKDIEITFGDKLISRGEAHITVITPPEYERLSAYLDISEIHTMFAATLQSTSFGIDCVGRSQAVLDGVIESTYYLVVDSTGLDDIRQQISRHYQLAGGPKPAFAQPFHPHITIGFTRRDLYTEDGAVKNRASCVAGLIDPGVA